MRFGFWPSTLWRWTWWGVHRTADGARVLDLGPLAIYFGR